MTSIGPNTHIEGRVEGNEDVTVYGTVSGSITLTANLVIADGGQVHGDVIANEILVHGFVDGSLKATQLLVLAETARVVAKIDTVSLRMDDGAQLSGDVLMDVEGEVPARKPSSSAPKTQKMPAVKGKALIEETIVEEEEEEDEYWTFDDLTVKELRDLLREYDQPVTGTKAELIERLEELED